MFSCFYILAWCRSRFLTFSINSSSVVSNLHCSVLVCLTVCPANEHYEDCGTVCPKVCNRPDPRVCPMMCKQGCFCNEGFRLSQETDGVCVHESQCSGRIKWLILLGRLNYDTYWDQAWLVWQRPLEETNQMLAFCEKLKHGPSLAFA